MENQIDIKLSLMDQQSGVAFDEFVKAIASIQPAMEAMQATSKNIADANQATSKSFKQSNASRSTGSGTGDDDAPRSGEASEKASHSEDGKINPLAHLLARVMPTQGSRDYLDKLAAGHLPYTEGRTDRATNTRINPDGGFHPIKVFRSKDGNIGQRLEYAAAQGLNYVANKDHPILNWFKEPQNLFTATYMYDRFKPMLAPRLNNPQNTGSALGYARDSPSPIPTDIVIPGTDIGFQAPWAPFTTQAGRHAISEWADRRWKGFKTAGISHKDVGDIQKALYAYGWTEGDHRDRMEDGLIDVKRRFKGMNTEQATKIMDQAVRHGTGYVDDMVRVLKEVPGVARNAGIGMNEFLDAMDEVANQAQEQGATYEQGAKWAQEASRITGMDPRISQTLADNSFVQARVMATTGLMPQEQALLNPGTRAALNSRSVQEVVRMYSGFGDRTIKDEFGGSETISGEDRAIAFAADKLGLSPDVVKQMMEDAPRQEALSQVDRMATATQKQIDVLAQRGDFDTAKKLLTDPNYVNADDDFTSWGETKKALDEALKKEAITEDEYKAVEGAGSKKLKAAERERDPKAKAKLLREAAQERAEAAQQAIEDSTDRHTDKTVGKQNVSVDIKYTGPKWFDIRTRVPDAKDEARSGGRLANRPDITAAPRLYAHGDPYKDGG